MSGITTDLETIKRTVAIGPCSAYCMGCEQDYNGGLTCMNCGTEVRFLALAYRPSGHNHKPIVERFALESGLTAEWLGYVTGPEEISDNIL